MKVLFVSSGNSETFPIAPFIKSQGESLIRNGVELKYYSILGKGFKGYLDNVKKLRQIVKEFNPDLIHSHYSMSGWVSIFAAHKKSMVLSLMGSDVHGGNTKPVFNFILMLQVILIQLFNKVIIIKSKNLSKVIWARKKTRVIPNGVNFKVFKPMDQKNVREKLKLSNEKKYVLFVAKTTDSNKNFGLLENAMEFVQTKNIELLSPYPVPHHELALYYNACDVLVFPSIKEGSPNVIKEALACNTRIVATDCGDIAERTKKIESVTICRNDSKDLAKKIDEQLGNNREVNSRTAIKDELDEDMIAKKLISIYKGILKYEQ